MKIRTGFVSNSSSSSFIIEQKHLTTKQLDKLLEMSGQKTEWTIEHHCPIVYGHTMMTNFDMIDWMKKNKFPVKKVMVWHSNDRDAFPENCAWKKSVKKEKWFKKPMDG